MSQITMLIIICLSSLSICLVFANWAGESIGAVTLLVCLHACAILFTPPARDSVG